MSLFDDANDGDGLTGNSGFGSSQGDGQSNDPYYQVQPAGPYAGWSRYALDNLKSSLSPVDFGNFLNDRITTYGGNRMRQDPSDPPSQFKFDYDPADYGAPASGQPDNTGRADRNSDYPDYGGGMGGGFNDGSGGGSSLFGNSLFGPDEAQAGGLDSVCDQFYRGEGRILYSVTSKEGQKSILLKENYDPRALDCYKRNGFYVCATGGQCQDDYNKRQGQDPWWIPKWY
ncbi:MAG: hypothetical protein HQK81_14650 [Desulfovibrionaceae bacterium]|nr:hypothetical protein [Desulfovibrionaceae bacterium]MBF0515284.1 hypothetical protein [Desulfovibrionaceae bacterium]